MPVVGLAMPGGTWREMSFVLTRKPDGSPANAITYGAFLGNVVDFLIVAMAVFLITKALLKPAPAGAPSTKECSECKEIIPIAARKCRACASPQPRDARRHHRLGPGGFLRGGGAAQAARCPGGHARASCRRPTDWCVAASRPTTRRSSR
jgi:hypothetical protein